MGFFTKSKLEKAVKNRELDAIRGLLNDSDKEVAKNARLAFIKIASMSKNLAEKHQKLMDKFTTSSVDDIRRAALRAAINRRDLADAEQIANILNGPDAAALSQAVIDYAYKLAKEDQEKKKVILAAFTDTQKIMEIVQSDLNGHPAGDQRVTRALEIVSIFNLWSSPKLVDSAMTALTETKDNPDLELPDHIFTVIANTQGSEATKDLLDYLRLSSKDENRKIQVKNCITKLGDGTVDRLIDEFDAYAERNVSQDQNATSYEDDDYLTSITTLEIIVETAPKGHERAIHLLGDIVADTKYARTGRHTKLARKGLDRIRGDIF